MGQGQNEVRGKSHKWAMTMRSGGFSLEADVSPCSWCSGSALLLGQAGEWKGSSHHGSGADSHRF